MNRNSGFTIFELMITLAIVAILATIAVPSYQNSVTKSKIKEAQSNLVALSLSVENIYQRTLSYPVLDLTNTAGIKGNATFKMWNPTSATFSYAYKSTDSAAYMLTATGVDAKVAGCTLTLSNDGTRTVSGCSVSTGWAN